jgi:hypothetical protein
MPTIRSVAISSLALTLLVAVSPLSGCARGVRSDSPDVGGDRADYPVTVFTNDQPVGESLLKLIRKRGYTHEGGEVLGNPNEEFNIKWGGAPIAMVHELAALVKERYGRELRLLQMFEPDDHDIFINMPLGGYNSSDGGSGDSGPPLAPEDITRATVHIVVFCDDEAVARETLERLSSMGYSNSENSSQGMPNDNFNIKWGAANEEIVEEIAKMLEAKFSQEFRRSHEFAPNDLDVFINLPVPAAQPGTGI